MKCNVYSERKANNDLHKEEQNENEGENGCVEVAKHLSVAGE